MVIFNNMAAMSALNETKRNDGTLGKVIKKAASGMKINSAGDDASGYSISARMKVRLRALNQDDENVRKGESLLRIAEGAIQSQMNLLKTVKERVINAHNDTNTDVDRAIIQKEIDQCYEQISSIAYDTDFDGKKLLIGNKIAEKVSSWVVLDEAVLVEDSNIQGLLINTPFDTLDGETGPFDTFGSSSDRFPYDGYNVRNVSPVTLEGAASTNTNGNKMVGGTSGTGNVIELDLSLYTAFSGTNKAPLDDTSFSVTYPYGSYEFVLTADTSRNYLRGTKIDISSCNSVADVADAIRSAIASNSSLNSRYNVSVNGSKVVLSTKADGADTNARYNVAGITMNSASVTTPGRDYAPPTGLASGSFGSFSGGNNAVTRVEMRPDPNDPDHQIPTTVVVTPATNAQKTITGISSVASGSGMGLHGRYGTEYIVFVDGSSPLMKDTSKGYYTVGKNYNGSFTLSGVRCTMSGGNLTAVAGNSGTTGNSYYFSNGVQPNPTSTKVYTATTPLGGIDNKRTGTDGARAHWDIDLSAYGGTGSALAEQLIDKYVGKAISISGLSHEYEFVDTGSVSGMDGIYKLSSETIELNNVRTMVAAGKTVAEAFASVVDSKFGSRTELIYDPANNTVVSGISFLASVSGTAGNNESITVREGDLRSYTVDWKNWVDTQGITNIPSALHEKGFRFYCPTDSSQWVNVRFVDGSTPMEADKPASGTSALDIKTVTIDVQGIDSVENLVRLIDNDLGNYLRDSYKHNLLLASDPSAGTITIYDKRRKHVMNDAGYDNQEKGGKIATGVMDNVVKDTRNIYVNDLVIQHTDKANMNIHIKIPQTSIDQIFGYKEGTHHITEYNVMNREMRIRLLGEPPEKGILDTGIEYLTDAQTLIGAQIKHMHFADENIVTQSENLSAAVSVVQDADMAKTMMEYAKYNILQQASQSMLAQANQTPNGVLNLLQ